MQFNEVTFTYIPISMVREYKITDKELTGLKGEVCKKYVMVVFFGKE